MSEEKPEAAPAAAAPKKIRLKGFAKLIGGLVDRAMKNPEAKEYIRGLRTRVCLNNLEDKKWACIVTIDKDQVRVQGVEKLDKKSLDRKKLHYWGYWEMNGLATMLTAGKWKSGKWIRKMARGTVHGASQIAYIGQLLAFARAPAPAEAEKK